MKNKSHMKWAWTIMIGFLTLGIVDFRFGILGFACMGAPMYHALRGRGKVHCQKFCPRGSLLGRMLEKVSMQNKLPKFMMKKSFKHGLLVVMVTVFSISMYHAGWNFNKIAFSMFRFMTMSLAIGIIMGVFFKPRSWCTVCPMGTGTGLIQKQVGKQDLLGGLQMPGKKIPQPSQIVQLEKKLNDKKAA
ncbi:4Fe-4S binding protein [Fusibacter sp. JL216-2]|uniref:4Fe-4S binding protein n=1 Tax=Fusibacter sp. JL216-2 TaxID=3071453 RepID=UPI003D339807